MCLLIDVMSIIGVRALPLELYTEPFASDLEAIHVLDRHAGVFWCTITHKACW